MGNQKRRLTECSISIIIPSYVLSLGGGRFRLCIYVILQTKSQIQYYALLIPSTYCLRGVADLYHAVMLFVPCAEVDERDVKNVAKSDRLCHVGRTLGSPGIVHGTISWNQSFEKVCFEKFAKSGLTASGSLRRMLQPLGDLLFPGPGSCWVSKLKRSTTCHVFVAVRSCSVHL